MDMIWIVAAGLQAAAQPAADCRDMVARDAAGEHRVRMCRSADGTWRRLPAMVGGGNGAPPFRGRIVYEGRFSGSVAVQGRPPRLDLGNFARSLQRMANAPRPQTIEGPVRLTLDFEGERVTASYSAGALGTGSLSGQVVAGECRLSGSDGSASMTGRCDAGEFSGRFQGAMRTGREIGFRFAARAVQSVDFETRDRQRAEAQAAADQARREAERQAALMLASLTRKAEAGDRDAMELLGQMYRDGDGVSRNVGVAHGWFRRAVERGSAWAAAQLGTAHAKGDGVEQSAARAHDWYLRCAAMPGGQKVSTTCAALVGFGYYLGQGVVRNQAEAIRWFRVCARLKDDGCIDWLNEHNVSLEPAAGRRR